jgi:hypothetical protein
MNSIEHSSLFEIITPEAKGLVLLSNGSYCIRTFV